MEYRALGSTDYRVSAVGLACRVGWPDDRGIVRVDPNEMIAAIQAGLDQGVNYVEIEPGPLAAECQEVVGKAVQGRGEGIILACPCGGPPARFSSTDSQVLRADSVAAEIEAGLRRLRISRIDVALCHWSDVRAPLAEVMAALLRLQERGDVGMIALSEFPVERIVEARRLGTVHVVRTPVNLLERDLCVDCIAYCCEYRLGLVAADPLCRGALSGPVIRERDTEPPARSRDRTGPSPKERETIRRLAAFAELKGRTLGQLAIAWALAQRGVSDVVCPAARPTQVREYIGAAGLALSAADIDEVEKTLSASDNRSIR